MYDLLNSLTPELRGIDLREELVMPVYPLREMQQWWDLKVEILNDVAAIYWSADKPGIAKLAENLMEKIKAIESISPPNKEPQE